MVNESLAQIASGVSGQRAFDEFRRRLARDLHALAQRIPDRCDDLVLDAIAAAQVARSALRSQRQHGDFVRPQEISRRQAGLHRQVHDRCDQAVVCEGLDRLAVATQLEWGDVTQAPAKKAAHATAGRQPPASAPCQKADFDQAVSRKSAAIPSIEDDPDIDALARSIRKRGLQEPLILTADNYIVSGHRRYEALRRMDQVVAPCRMLDVRRDSMTTDEYIALLRDHNRQRSKSVAEQLREELVDIDPAEAYRRLKALRDKSVYADEYSDVQSLVIEGAKVRPRYQRPKSPTR